MLFQENHGLVEHSDFRETRVTVHCYSLKSVFNGMRLLMSTSQFIISSQNTFVFQIFTFNYIKKYSMTD